MFALEKKKDLGSSLQLCIKISAWSIQYLMLILENAPTYQNWNNFTLVPI